MFDKLVETVLGDVITWHCPWLTRNATNYITSLEYSGNNATILELEVADKGYVSNFWLTFNQAKQAKGSIKKGSKGIQLNRYGVVEKERKDGTKYNQSFVKGFVVFNLEQTTLYDGSVIECNCNSFEPITELENLFQAYLNGNNIELKKGTKAFYFPSNDSITMPNQGLFKSTVAYYKTLSHEIVHSTAPRLDRVLNGDKNSSEYAFEELIAEIAALSIVSNHIEIPYEVFTNSVAYIQHWLGHYTNDSTSNEVKCIILKNAYDDALKVVNLLS